MGFQTAALAPVPIPPLAPGARGVELAQPHIDQGKLIATWVVLEAEDPLCCPTGGLTTVSRWDGDGFDTSGA